MLNVQSIYATQLQLDSDHSQLKGDALQLSSLIIQVSFLDQLKHRAQLSIRQLCILAGLRSFLFCMVAASNIVEKQELEVNILAVTLLTYSTGRPVDLICTVGFY